MEKKRSRTAFEKHTVDCPHCGKAVLDHMTQCPFCSGALEPAGYRPMDDKKRRRVKIIANVIGFAAAAAVILWLLFGR